MTDGLELLAAPHRRWMKAALREAEKAAEEGEVPVGAVVVRDNQIVGRGRNMVERLMDPTAHAELIALTAACTTLGSKHLDGCTLYVTLEPCPMCAGAAVWARLERLVFGAFDAKAGAASTLYDIPRDTRLNHQMDVISGIEAERAEGLLRDFFMRLREEATPGGNGATG